MGRKKDITPKYTTSISIPLEYRERIQAGGIGLGQLVVLGLGVAVIQKENEDLKDQLDKKEKLRLMQETALKDSWDEVDRLRLEIYTLKHPQPPVINDTQ